LQAPPLVQWGVLVLWYVVLAVIGLQIDGRWRRFKQA